MAFRAAICSRELGRLWVPPAGHYDPAARSIAVRPPGGQSRGRKRGPRPKIARWSAERRASLIARGREAPRKRLGVPIARHARGVSRQRVYARLDALCTPRRLGALLPVMRGKELENAAPARELQRAA